MWRGGENKKRPFELLTIKYRVKGARSSRREPYAISFFENMVRLHERTRPIDQYGCEAEESLRLRPFTERPVPMCPGTSVTFPPLCSTSAASLSTSAIFSATSFPTRSRYCCRLYCPLFDSLGYSQVISRLAHWLCHTTRRRQRETARK